MEKGITANHDLCLSLVIGHPNKAYSLLADWQQAWLLTCQQALFLPKDIHNT
jgi:hypothetical protein